LAAWTEKFNELSDDTSLAQHSSAGQNQVSGSGVSWQLSNQFEADDLGQHHGDLLAKHHRFSFDTADTPADDTETVDHGRVRVSANHRVGVDEAISDESDTGEPLKIDLVHDTIARWHDSEVLKGLFSPLEEGKALLVTLEFDSLVLLLSIGLSGDIDLD